MRKDNEPKYRTILSLLAFAVVASTTNVSRAGEPPIAAVAASAPAQTPARAFYQHPAILQSRLSPDGRYLALNSVRDDQHASLIVLDLESSAPATAVASFRNVDVVWFKWVSDKRLVYTVGALQPGRGEGYLPGLFAVNADGSNSKELLCADLKGCTYEGQWQDLSSRLLMVPRAHSGVGPSRVVIGQFSRGAGLHVTPQWMDVDTGLTEKMEMPSPPDEAQAWWFDQNGTPRLLAVFDHDEVHESFYWWGPGEKSWALLARFDRLDPPFWPHTITTDGRLYVTAARGQRGEESLAEFDFATHAPKDAALVKVPGFDFDGEVLLDERGQKIDGVWVDAETPTMVWLEQDMQPVQAAVDRLLPGRSNSIACVHCGTPKMIAVVRSESDRDPGRLLLYRASTRKWESVADIMPGIDPNSMAHVSLRRIQARDGEEIPLWITRPAGSLEGKALPTVVLVHGGPWTRAGHWEWSADAQFLASRGYLVLEPEFRGSTGYGKAHFAAGFKQWGRAMQDDVADSLRWARTAGLSNDQACIAGASYGGYSVFMGLIRDPELYRCGIAWVGVADLSLYLKGGMFVLDDISEITRRYGLPQLVGDAKTDEQMLKEVSPLEQADRIRRPLLVAYGGRDTRVPIEHGERLRKAMTRAGNAPEWVEYAKEGHGWRSLPDRIDWAEHMERFLAEHLKQGAAAN